MWACPPLLNGCLSLSLTEVIAASGSYVHPADADFKAWLRRETVLAESIGSPVSRCAPLRCD
jgi:hypothetical protein